MILDTQCLIILSVQYHAIHGRGQGGGGYSSVACLKHLTIDHASVSSRSTVTTRSKGHLQHLGAHCVFFCIVRTTVLLILSPSCFAVCGNHPSQRSFSRNHIAYQTAQCHIHSSTIYFPHPSPLPTYPVSPCLFHIFPLRYVSSIVSVALPQGRIYLCIFFEEDAQIDAPLRQSNRNYRTHIS